MENEKNADSKLEIKYLCRICGYKHDSPPWGEDGNLASFEICFCCGIEFGYEDSTLKGIRRYRASWLESGAPWFQPSDQPEGWDLQKQLAQIPKEFL